MKLLRSIAVTLGWVEEPSLNGIWERGGDHFAGCRIELTPEGAGWTGILTFVPEKMRQFGWVFGDRKWIEIRKTGAGRYALMDLYKALDRKTGKVAEIYGEALLEFDTDERLLLEPAQQSHERESQSWQRVREPATR